MGLSVSRTPTPAIGKAASDRGRQNQQVERCPKVVDIYDVRTPEGTLHLLAECLTLTRAGLLPTKVGHTVAALANSARAYHELCDLADRVAALEESVGRTHLRRA